MLSCAVVSRGPAVEFLLLVCGMEVLMVPTEIKADKPQSRVRYMFMVRSIIIGWKIWKNNKQNNVLLKRSKREKAMCHVSVTSCDLVILSCVFHHIECYRTTAFDSEIHWCI